jgi:hypothetical protein
MQNKVIGDPVGSVHRILDVPSAVTGRQASVPSQDLVGQLPNCQFGAASIGDTSAEPRR